MGASFQTRPGAPVPLGATPGDDGVNFAVFSRNGTRVWLALFAEDDQGGQDPVAEFALDSPAHRFGDVWCVFVEGARPGMRYMYRVDGPSSGKRNTFFDARRFVLDPCARAIVGDVDTQNVRGVISAAEPGPAADSRPCTALKDTLIYEVHVKGFTAHPSADVEHAGTYRGFHERIPYLRDLGVTAVEFLPVHHCGERRLADRTHPETGEPLVNYWGYQPIGYFAPDGYYGSRGGTGEQRDEFRALVDALHDAGIEVLVDVVLNHTSEGDERGPALCFRAIDNAIYYYIDGDGRYRDMTGCGNTVNCNHPVVLEFMHQCLRHWVLELGVDGFRFDLACVINRDRFGNLQRTSPLVDLLSEDPVLRNVKLIAEPWDLGGGYQVGGFGWHRWSEWNDRFRDDVRRFWKGDPGMKGAFASRLTGSPDLYQHDGRLPQSSINFITAHDGFTLRDLVSYQRKHNKANGENNRDGSDHGNSWNCGVEGETDDAIVQALRARQQKNLLASLLLSLGTPMLLGGDEFGRTQHGNNNAYCQDNELSWFDWTLLEKNAELHRFCRALIRFRRENPVLTQTRFFTGKPAVKGGSPDLAWYDPAGKALDWAARDGCLACRMDGAHNHGRALYFMFNPTSDACEFRPAAGAWRMRFYTGKGAPFDAPDEDDAPRLEKGDSVVLGQRTMMVLDGADD